MMKIATAIADVQRVLMLCKELLSTLQYMKSSILTTNLRGRALVSPILQMKN